MNEKEKNDPRVQAMFERSEHNHIPIIIINQDYYELPGRTIGANGNIIHIFKANNNRDVQNLYEDEASMDMKPNEFNLLTCSCWKERYHPLTLDLTTKYSGRYRLELNSVFVPDGSPF